MLYMLNDQVTVNGDGPYKVSEATPAQNLIWPYTACYTLTNGATKIYRVPEDWLEPYGPMRVDGQQALTLWSRPGSM